MGAGGYKRIKVVSEPNSGPTSITVTFDEAEPLDGTHLLMGVLFYKDPVAATPAVPAGWTAIISSATANAQFRGVVRQGNAAINGVTFPVPSTAVDRHAILVAFEGYQNTTRISPSAGFFNTDPADNEIKNQIATNQQSVILAITRQTSPATPLAWGGGVEGVFMNDYGTVGLLHVPSSGTYQIPIAYTAPASNVYIAEMAFAATAYAPPAPSASADGAVTVGATTTPPVVTYARTGVAALDLTGSADATVQYVRTGNGTVTLDGDTTAPIVTARATGTGILNLTGTGTGRVTHARAGDGTLGLDGTATGTATLVRTGNAALTLTGMGDNRGRRDLRIVSITETTRTVTARDTSRVVAIDNRTRHVNIEETSA